jgi:hypothetical protein
LSCGDRAEIDPSDRRGEAQSLHRGAKLRLPEALARDLGSRPQSRERQDVCDDTALYVELDRSRERAEGNRRARRKARFDHDGLRDPEFVICGLQAAVVEQRCLDGCLQR